MDALWKRGYNPYHYYNNNHELKAVVDMLTSGVLGSYFHEIYQSLLTNRYGQPDVYMTLADFASYAKVQERVSQVYLDQRKFTNMSLVNIAKAGLFSSDRAIQEYSDNIWHTESVK